MAEGWRFSPHWELYEVRVAETDRNIGIQKIDTKVCGFNIGLDLDISRVSVSVLVSVGSPTPFFVSRARILYQVKSRYHYKSRDIFLVSVSVPIQTDVKNQSQYQIRLMSSISIVAKFYVPSVSAPALCHKLHHPALPLYSY